MIVESFNNQTVACECGKRKRATRLACDSCTLLDGRSTAEHDVIMALLINGPSTTNQLIDYMGSPSVARLLYRMKDRGILTTSMVDQYIERVRGFGWPLGPRGPVTILLWRLNKR